MKAKPPIFVLGCPRSGTTLLYHMLLSAGDFAIYRAETHVFNLVAPRFGNLRKRSTRSRMMEQWLKTDYFARTGLHAQALRARILDDCNNAGDFLRILMESMAEQQGVTRWSECTPEHLLYIKQLKQSIPNAKVIHIIRDGRDVAASLDKQGWIRPLPLDKKHSLLVSGLYWEWMVQRGRKLGARIAPDYMEVSFEDLVGKPHSTLQSIGIFIDQKLDYDEIQRRGIGSVSQPNTSFPGDSRESFNPVGRWKDRAPLEIARLEALLARSLRDLGYPLVTRDPVRRDFELRRMRTIYRSLFAIKHWLKSETFLGRMSDASLLYAPIGDEKTAMTGQTKTTTNS